MSPVFLIPTILLPFAGGVCLPVFRIKSDRAVCRFTMAVTLLASMAVDCLLDKITNDQAGYSHRILYPSLVERSSCRDITGKEEE